MKENMQKFQYACRIYLSTLGIGDLRNYGREIGVARPTAKNKERLISDVIGILSGDLLPVPVSKQGAPVKNDRVDERIPKKISQFRQQFFEEELRVDIPEFISHINKKRGDELLTMDAPILEEMGSVSKNQVIGQAHYTKDGKCFLLPIEFLDLDKKVYIPNDLREDKRLREGDILSCYIRKGENFAMVEDITTVNGIQEINTRPKFDECSVCNSQERLTVYDGKNYDSVSLKFIEWLLPIAKGQRACVIAPPKAGKTQFLLRLAQATAALNDKVEVYILLIDQSPEGVREFLSVMGKERVFYTTYEDDAERQVLVADLLLERLKRQAEVGKDTVLVVDSLSALARAFNDTEDSAGGKTLSCGLEIKTVRYIKKYFGSARCLERGGSLTIFGGVSVDTGNPFDDVVCSEFSAQANYEIRLDNSLAVRRIYPAIDLAATNVKQNASLKTEAEEEFDFLLRNEKLPKLGSIGLLKVLSDVNSYHEFIERIEKI